MESLFVYVGIPLLIEKSLKLRTFASAGVENPRLKWRAAKRPSDAQWTRFI